MPSYKLAPTGAHTSLLRRPFLLLFLSLFGILALYQILPRLRGLVVQISTHKLASIQFFDNFVPKACGNSTKTPKPPSLGSAVTIGAGVVLKQLYDAVGERNLAVAAGFSHTVGAAGGYVQGGGHSPMGPLFGMASDNALQYEVVH